MSSIIKRGSIVQGSVIKLQDQVKLIDFEQVLDSKVSIEELPARQEDIDDNQLRKEALEEKENILLQAREEAANLLREAKEEAEQIKQEAFQKKQEILEYARIQEKEIVEEAKEEATHTIEAALQEKHHILSSLESEVVEIIKLLVSHIIHEEIATGYKWLNYIVRKMLVKENLTGDLTVYVSPTLLERLSEKEYNSLKSIKESLKVLSDESMSDTSCIIETLEGSILYDLSEGLDKVLKDLNRLDQLAGEVMYDRV